MKKFQRTKHRLGYASLAWALVLHGCFWLGICHLFYPYSLRWTPYTVPIFLLLVCILSGIGIAYLNWLEKLSHRKLHWLAALLAIYLMLGTPFLLIASFARLPWLFISWSQETQTNIPGAFISINPVSNSPSGGYSLLQIRDDSEGCTYEVFRNQFILQQHVGWLGVNSLVCRDSQPVAIAWGEDEQWVSWKSGDRGGSLPLSDP